MTPTRGRIPGQTAIAAVALLVAVLVTSCSAENDSISDFDVTEASIQDLQTAMTDGTVTSAELVEAYVARIAAYDRAGPALNALVRLNPRAFEEADALDAERAAGTVRGPMHGIPVLIKDNYDLAGMPTTGSSLALADLMPTDDAFQVARLREAGAIVIGKTNLHELAAGITTVSSLGGQSRNPYDPRRNPGGSSGGTGAGVAASFAAVGWGSDTCGSIRIPASVHNLFGLRPTKGLSSIDGILPLSHSQDTGGPLARTVTDLAIALDVTVGPDEADPATGIMADRGLPSFRESLDTRALSGVRIGVIAAWLDADGDESSDQRAQPAVAEVIRGALQEMEVAGAEIIDVTVPDLDALLANTGLIDFEFKFDLMDYLVAVPGAPVGSLEEILGAGLHHEQLDRTFRRRNQRDSRDSEELRETLARRDLLRDAVVAFMDAEELDALAYPTIRNETALIGTPAVGSTCFLSAHTGLPALSMPAGFTDRDLPVGLEILGRPLHDHRLVSIAFGFESTGSRRRAPLRTPPLVDGTAPPPISLEITSVVVEDRADLPGGSVASPVNPGVAGSMTVDLPSGELRYDLSLLGVVSTDAYGVVLRRAGEEGMVVVRRLAGPGENQPRGTLDLTPRLMGDLLAGRVELLVRTTEGYEQLRLRPATE